MYQALLTSTAPRRGRCPYLRRYLAGVGATLVAVTVAFLVVRVDPGALAREFSPAYESGLVPTGVSRDLLSVQYVHDYGMTDPGVLLTGSIEEAYAAWLRTRFASPVVFAPLLAAGVVAAVAELVTRRL